MQRPAAALILLASFLSFLVACPILAGPIEDSKKAYQRGDYKTAFQLIKPQAEKGDATAQFMLGFMYSNSQGVPQDFAEAMKWYRKAADQGDADAQSNLGYMYSNGQGVPQDYAEAIKWYSKAAKQGNKAAQHNLGLMVDKGQVSKDRA